MIHNCVAGLGRSMWDVFQPQKMLDVVYSLEKLKQNGGFIMFILLLIPARFEFSIVYIFLT